jgi:uncharacterized protein YegL
MRHAAADAGGPIMPALQVSVNNEARRLPVIILADVSDSMGGPVGEGGGRKIDALNSGVKKLIEHCAAADGVQICVAVIAFGGDRADLALPLTPAKGAHWSDMGIRGMTPLGSALRMAMDLVEDGGLITDRDYRPILVVSSDGKPNDDWQTPLKTLDKAERGSKADRFAIAIGADADQSVLNEFLHPALKSEEATAKLFFAGSEKQLFEAFKLISNTASVRSTSRNPDEKPAVAMWDPSALA